MRARGRVEPVFIQQPRELLEVLPGLLADGDQVLLQGAGSITAAAQDVLARGHLRTTV